MNPDNARRSWLAAAGVLLGLLAGVVVSLAGPTSREARASVLISSPSGPGAVTPLLPNLRELAESGVVAGNVRSTLRLPESTEELRRNLHASVRPRSQVIAIAAKDANADHARQLAQEAAAVFAQLVDARFGNSKPELHAAVLDSAHALAGPDRHFVRNALIGALVGLLLGSSAMFLLAGGRREVATATAPGAPVADDRELGQRERLFEERLRGVASRERALAERAGRVAAREQALREQAETLATRERERADSPAVVETIEPPPQPLPEPVASHESEPVAPTADRLSRRSSWNVNDLQDAVDSRTDAAPERVEEWLTYLFFLREHAAADGSLPSQFEGLAEDVFGDILDR